MGNMPHFRYHTFRQTYIYIFLRDIKVHRMEGQYNIVVTYYTAKCITKLSSSVTLYSFFEFCGYRYCLESWYRRKNIFSPSGFIYSPLLPTMIVIFCPFFKLAFGTKSCKSGKKIRGWEFAEACIKAFGNFFFLFRNYILYTLTRKNSTKNFFFFLR